MIVDLDTLKTFMGIAETDDSENELLELYLNAVDTLVNSMSDYEFDSTTYTNEVYNGSGNQRLWLKHIPVTAITQISADRIPAVKIKNTSSGAARATVNVDVSGQELSYTLVVGASLSTGVIDLTDAGSDTLAELVTTIDAIGSSWDAEMQDTDLNTIPSTELLGVLGLNCGPPRGGGDAEFRELDIPGTPLGDDFVMDDAEMGMIYRQTGWPKGVNNVVVTYTAGYTEATMPSDLKMGVLAGAQALYERGEQAGFGVSNFSQSSLRVSYGDWLPDITLQQIEFYRRKVI